MSATRKSRSGEALRVARFDVQRQGPYTMITAYGPRGQELGVLDMQRRKVKGHRYLAVVYAGVKITGAGIGTKLYERAAQIACGAGTPLVSDTQRTRFSQGFWDKQASKGRAICLQRGGSVRLSDDFDPKGAWGCGRYQLVCRGRRAPRSLAGVRL